MTTQCPVCDGAVSAGATVCPSCGFNLVGATQRFEPVPIANQSDTKASTHNRAQGVLRVVRGPQNGLVFRLGDTECIIGRNPHCDIFLNDMTVSRNHAIIEPVENGYVIRDTNSFNGVWVNDRNIESHVLENGDILQICTFCLVFNEE